MFPGEYWVHSRFKRVVNFVHGERLVSVVTEEVGRGPVNIVLRGIDLQRLNDLRIDDRAIYLDEQAFSRERADIFSSRLEVDDLTPARLTQNLEVLQKDLGVFSPKSGLLIDPARKRYFTTKSEREFVRRIEEAVTAITHKDPPGLLSGIRKLKGLGWPDTKRGRLHCRAPGRLQSPGISGRDQPFRIEKRDRRCRPVGQPALELVYHTGRGRVPLRRVQGIGRSIASGGCR